MTLRIARLFPVTRDTSKHLKLGVTETREGHLTEPMIQHLLSLDRRSPRGNPPKIWKELACRFTTTSAKSMASSRSASR